MVLAHQFVAVLHQQRQSFVLRLHQLVERFVFLELGHDFVGCRAKIRSQESGFLGFAGGFNLLGIATEKLKIQ
jgi:hypothetical protein